MPEEDQSTQQPKCCNSNKNEDICLTVNNVNNDNSPTDILTEMFWDIVNPKGRCLKLYLPNCMLKVHSMIES